MNLPDGLLADFQKRTSAAPTLAVRALYDLAGKLGHTYLAATAQTLVLYSQPAGQRAHVIQFELNQIDYLQLHPQGTFTTLELCAEGQTYQLKFSPWDRELLEELHALWRPHARTRPSTPAGVAPSPLTPLIAFCAALQAMIQSDGTTDSLEMYMLGELIPREDAIEAGGGYLRGQGLDAVLAELPSLLNPAQKLCLYSNVIAVAMLDGLLRSSEQVLLEKFQQTLEITPDQHARIFNVLMTKNRLSVFLEADEAIVEEPTPLTAFCASLQAMMAADQAIAGQETELLFRRVQDFDVVERGVRYFREQGLENLLRQLGAILDKAQRECLLANLLAVAMADGVLHTSEQELLERFQAALHLDPALVQQFNDVLLTKNNLTVLEE